MNEATLTDVCYMPEFDVNLLSVHRLTTHGANVSFNDHAAVISKGENPPIVVPKVGNLYRLNNEAVSRNNYVSYNVTHTNDR